MSEQVRLTPAQCEAAAALAKDLRVPHAVIQQTGAGQIVRVWCGTTSRLLDSLGGVVS